MMKNIKYFLIVLLLPFVCFGQDDDVSNIDSFNKIIIPPTPEVASLGKYVETPVNEFTGIPKIQIPIYSIEEGRIKHDIGLSYHAQGVKVEEIASRVGMGWSLNAGGIISRQKRGEPDESSFGYLNTSNKVNEFLESGLDVVNAHPFFIDKDFRGRRDYEPDLFTFSFGQYSGSFFFDQETKDLIFKEVSPLKVEWINYSYFKITTPDGVEYYFGADKNGDSIENTKQLKLGEDILDIHTIGRYYSSSVDETDVSRYPDHTTTWYLAEIYDPTNDDNITFDYEEYDLGILRQRLSSAALLEYRPAPRVSFEHTLSEQKVSEKILTQINFNNGKVSFIKDEEEREDQKGSFALKRINIYANDNKIIKSYGLNHDIIESNDDGKSSDDLYDFYRLANRTKRLFLLNLREFKINKSNNSILSNDFKEYTFSYKTPENLPHRFSTAQDLWGFYNGETSNKNLLPKDFKVVNNKIVELGQANRQINQTYSQSGVLTKITYPTGGFAEYRYESNRAKKDVSVDAGLGSRLNPIYDSYVTEPVRLTFNDNNSGNNVEYFGGNLPYYSMSFKVEGIPRLDEFGNIIPVKVEINYTNNHNYFFQHPDCPSCPYPCATTNKNEDYCFDEEYWDSYIQNPRSYLNSSGRLHNRSGLNELYLEPGRTYSIILQFGENETVGTYDKRHEPDDWNITINYEKTETIDLLAEENSVLTGGLRVKEIIVDDLKGDVEKTSYLYEDENNITTGNFVSIPYHVSSLDYYYYKEVYRLICDPCRSVLTGSEHILGEKFSSESSVPLATTQGSYTGYDKVTKIREGGENGKTEYNFSFERDKLFMITKGNASNPSSFSSAFDFSPVPLQNNEVQRGNLLSQIEYNKEGNVVQKIINKYSITSFDDVDAVTSKLIVKGTGPDTILHGLGTYGITNNVIYITNQYRMFSRLKLLTESTSFSYDSNGENPVTTTTSFNYENAAFPSLQTGSVTTNSKNEVIETKTYYPDDIGGTTALEGGNLSTTEYSAIQRLKSGGSEYRIGQPIQQETYVNDVLTSVQRTNFSTKDGITLPSSMFAALASDNLEERLTYHSYDSKGNPEEVSQKDAVHTAYIWGYNQKYPVVKVDNATISSVESTLSAAELNNVRAGSYNDSQMRSVLNKIRTGLPNAMVTTYTYDPLVGVTSVTDPKGYTIYYSYDGFQRLESVKDADGNLLSTNEYNYKN